jgi:hypothetical protein
MALPPFLLPLRPLPSFSLPLRILSARVGSGRYSFACCAVWSTLPGLGPETSMQCQSQLLMLLENVNLRLDFSFAAQFPMLKDLEGGDERATKDHIVTRD